MFVIGNDMRVLNETSLSSVYATPARFAAPITG